MNQKRHLVNLQTGEVIKNVDPDNVGGLGLPEGFQFLDNITEHELLSFIKRVNLTTKNLPEVTVKEEYFRHKRWDVIERCYNILRDKYGIFDAIIMTPQ